MDPGGGAQKRIESIIRAFAQAEGIDPAPLKFIWDEQQEILAHDDQLALREPFQVLTVYLEKSWRILTFDESALEKVIRHPIRFHRAYRDKILDALRSLKKQTRQQPRLVGV